MSAPRRIALVVHELVRVGGLPTMTDFLRRVAIESGRYQPDIITIATSAADRSSVLLRSPRSWLRGIQVGTVTWRGIDHPHVGAWFSELEFQRYRPRRALTALLQQYDLVQVIAGTPAYAYAAAHVTCPLLVWTATTSWPDRASRFRTASVGRKAVSSLMIPIAQRYDRLALRRADAVFALSRYTLATVQPFAQPGRATLAPCGVDTALFQPGAIPRRYILSTARFSDARKNVTLLLRAYAETVRRRRTVPDLWLVGDAPSPANRVLMQELGIAEHVRLLGEKSAKELAALYREALMFVLPSDEEGLAIVVLEAMASGVPVVSTNCGGPATAITDGETGLLTPIGDVSAMVSSIERVLDDEGLRKRIAHAARRRIEDRFSIQAAGNVFLDKYDELLGRAPGQA
jgi:glycosyltransferase involved in cell wall biosynthesis